MIPHDKQEEPANIKAEQEGLHSRRVRIVIIGAGLAGLAAAQKLHQEFGLSSEADVLLLEAQDRIGGRVQSIEHGDYLLELGAQWLHGADKNPLYQWLSKLNMLDDFEDASLGFKGIFCAPNGRRIDSNLVNKVLEIANQSKTLLFKSTNLDDHVGDLKCDNLNNNQSKNAADIFKEQFELAIEQDEELSSQRELVEAIFEWFLRYETVENCCDSMQEVSISSYTDWTDWGDGALLNFKHGYRSLLQHLCGQFPAKEWLKLNAQVTKITRQSVPNKCISDEKENRRTLETGPIVVSCKSGARIGCNHVIVTCSLGFLKQRKETLFEPPLESWRSQLIDSIGFGTVNKIVLQFATPFWPSSGLKLIWPGRASEQSGQLFPDWTRDIVAFDSVRRQPNLLIGWIGGQGAKQLEACTNQEVGRVCLALFEAFLPERHQRPTRLVACFCSRWNSNPFVCGSYSFQSMLSYELDVDRLREPICEDANKVPRILFAGEATAGKLYSTTHGAIMTGWREAERLAAHLGALKPDISSSSS